MKAFSSSLASPASESSANVCRRSPNLPQAAMAALQLSTSGSIAASRKPRSSSSDCFHCPAFPQALIAAV
eukprot:9167758-Pyramimonas_sp.AAC.1